MLVIAGVAAAFLGCILLYRFDPYGEGGSWAVAGAILFGIALLLMAVTVPLNRMQWHARMAQAEAVRDSRQGGEAIEGAAWRAKVAEVNAMLAGGRYYNSTVFDIWIPDEVLSVKPIE
jgi:membrane-associated phospholipid phosphatase